MPLQGQERATRQQSQSSLCPSQRYGWASPSHRRGPRSCAGFSCERAVRGGYSTPSWYNAADRPLGSLAGFLQNGLAESSKRSRSELLGVKRQDVEPLAPLLMDHWSRVIAAEELNHPQNWNRRRACGARLSVAEVDDQGSPVLGKGSSSTASLQRQISQEIRRVGRLASPR